MSSIYARYVPPTAKKSQTPSTVVKEPTDVNKSSPAPIASSRPETKTDASSTYTRYTPPSSKSSPSSGDRLSLASQSAASPENKRKRIESQNVSAQQQPATKKFKHYETEQPEETKSNLDQNVAKLEKNAKKAKKVKANFEPIEHDDVLPEDDDRHKAVLAKKEKSLRKSQKLAKRAAQEASEAGIEEIPEEPIELHPLAPLPQPEPVPEPAQQSTFAALPAWLSAPIRVSPSTTADFTSIGLEEGTASFLKSKGYPEAFAVQAAALPLLLPKTSERWSDLCVSAATGSGKTLAYVLPMVKDLCPTIVPRLRGIVVVPTRELVRQVREVCELCADAFTETDTRRVKIGVSIGNQTLQAEQSAIMDDELCYDADEYKKQQDLVNDKWEDASNAADDTEEFILFTDEAPSRLPNTVVRPKPKIDILICTPGRLVEHIKTTPGFTLEYLKWLIIDEADKLLDQSFQQWKEVVMASLPKDSSDVTKVVLSATMTRDVGQLAGLKLRRPKLIVLDGGDASAVGEAGIQLTSESLNIPENLLESAVKVEDEGDKPLYLLHLIKEQLSSAMTKTTEHKSDDSSSCSGSDSSDSADAESDSTDSDSDAPTSPMSVDTPAKAYNSSSRGILVFTKSNENAIRLSRLIALMSPNLESKIGTLTSTILSSLRRKTLRNFKSGSIQIIIASDLVARGLDLPNLAHVVNYDLPTSLTSYVHRVGRTARAGKEGKAWTLFTPAEGRWFWHEIARSPRVSRTGGKKVDRYNVDAEKAFSESDRAAYESALEELGREAKGRAKAEKDN